MITDSVTDLLSFVSNIRKDSLNPVVLCLLIYICVILYILQLASERTLKRMLLKVHHSKLTKWMFWKHFKNETFICQIMNFTESMSIIWIIALLLLVVSGAGWCWCCCCQISANWLLCPGPPGRGRTTLPTLSGLLPRLKTPKVSTKFRGHFYNIQW